MSTDIATGETVLTVDPGYGGSRVYPDGLVFTEQARETYRIQEGDPTSASAESQWHIVLEHRHPQGAAQQPWRAEVHTRSLITADVEHYRIQNWLTATAWEGDGPAEVMAERYFDTSVPRTSA